MTNAISNVMPLEGYKVIDLSNMLTGPYCTRMLSDYGAEVIKVEPKTGDPARMHGPFLNDDPDLEKSGLFLFLNTNKRSITVDIETEEGQDVIRDLVKDASIVVENFKPGYLESLGLGYDALSAINPNLVMTSITNFGQTGPYKDWEGVDLTIWAMGGAMKTSGNGDYEPLKMAGRIASFHVGSVASLATLTALWQAEFQDEGDHVDVPFFETFMGAIDRHVGQLVGHQYTGNIAPRSIPGSRLAAGARPVSDGYFLITGGAQGGGRFFQRLMAMLGMEDQLNEFPWNDRSQYTEQDTIDLFESFYVPWMLEHTKDEVTDLVREYGVLGGAVNTVGDLLSIKQYRERDYWQEIEHPVAGSFEYPGYNFRPHGVEMPETRNPAPLLGQHTDEVLTDALGYSAEKIEQLHKSGAV